MNNPSSIQNLLPPTSALQQQTGNTWSDYLNQLFKGNPGQGVLDAATPVFQRNLQQGADILRQSGPRFASNTERLVGQQGQQAMQDFNLFSQQVMQEGVNQQLAGLQGAGQFTLGGQQNQLSFLGPLLQQMFGTSFAAGGMTQPGTLTQSQPWWQQALGAAGQIANIAGSVRGGTTFNNPYGPRPQGSSPGTPYNPPPFSNFG